VRVIAILPTLVLVSAASAQTTTQPSDNSPQAIDECGTLVEGNGCVLFQGAGGQYVIPVSSGDFQLGDAVRVVGTVDPSCVTICPEADGCIRGATLYDPAVLPCGTPLPNFPADIVTGVCSSLSAGLLALTLVGLLAARRRAAPTSRN
jgi:hypothetical protein